MIDADFFWISRPNVQLFDMIPYTGEKFYHRVATQYLLTMKRITFENIKYSIRASGHLDSDAFDGPFEIMEKCWSQCSQNFCKMAINSMIGLLGSQQNYVYHAVLSTNAQDASLLEGETAETRTGDVTQWTCRQKMLET